MLAFGNARPSDACAAVLRLHANEVLKNSLIHILKCCADAGYETGLLASVASLNTERKFSGFLHVLHDRLLRAINHDDERQIAELLDMSIVELKGQSDIINVFGWYLNGPSIGWAQYYYDASDESFLKTYGVHFDGQNPEIEEFRAAERALDQTFQVLQQIDIDAYEEMQCYVSDFAIFRSPTMNAATSIPSLGIIRLSQLRPGQTWTRYLENVVHEVGHHHLNFLMLQDPLILNESAKLFRSPLRREGRPLSGIYHAMFVLARSMRMIRRFESSGYFKPDMKVASSYNNAHNPASFVEKFEDCWNLLRDNAELTEIGGLLMRSAREMAFE